jgi:hypothetical protein
MLQELANTIDEALIETGSALEFVDHNYWTASCGRMFIGRVTLKAEEDLTRDMIVDDVAAIIDLLPIAGDLIHYEVYTVDLSVGVIYMSEVPYIPELPL